MQTHVHTLPVYLAALTVAIVIGAAGPATAEPLVIVVPNGMGATEGDGSTFYPMPPAFLDGARLQDILSALPFADLPGEMYLIQIASRPDQQMEAPITPLTVTMSNLELRLSTTTTDPSVMSTTFAENIDGAETLVYEGDWTFSIDGSGPPDGPRGFDLVVDFQTPFPYDPAQGSLLVDQRYSRVSESFAYDRTDPGAGEFRWIYALQPHASVGRFLGEPQDHHTYVQRFTFLPGLTWDGLGDGNWDDFRWSGNDPDVAPDSTTLVFVQSNTVNVATNANAYRLAINGGGELLVGSGNTLTISTDVELADGMLQIAPSGVLDVDSDILMEPPSGYVCQLDAAAGGLISAGGHASLSGLLIVEAVENLSAVGDTSRTIVTAEEINGTFTNEPAVGEHLGYGVFHQATTYNADSVDVDLFQAAAGDTDGNRQIDNADLQQILGAGSFNNPGQWGWPQGDFNGDTDVDNADLQLILATGDFGTGSYAAVAPGLLDAGVVTVPEPSTIAMLIGILSLLLLSRLHGCVPPHS